MALRQARKRIILILQLLYENSDEVSPLTTKDIMDHLKKHGITVDRKTFKEDIDFLINEMQYDIVAIKSSPNKYFWGERIFELPELKLLIDAVSSANFIGEKKSKTIINKLICMASEEQKEKLKRNIYGTGKAKSENNKLYYVVDILNEAINDKRKISFQYYEYNGYKERILRNNGEIYCISPYALYWNEDNYYVVGYSQKRGAIVPFRVDRIHKPEILSEEIVPKPDCFDIANYGKKIFKMYDGKEAVVKLECNDELMKYVIDRFGTDIKVTKCKNDSFITEVAVNLSPTFYGWVFQFAGKMKIIGPSEAIDEYNKMKCL